MPPVTHRTDPRDDKAGTGRDTPDKGLVLVVDDSPLIQRVVSYVLTAEGFRTQSVGDGESAIRMLQEQRFDVAVSDLTMPGLDGFGLLSAARALPEPPEVVLLTGTRADDFGAAVRALRLGAHDFLTKPPREDELVLAVARAVETKRLKEENRRLVRELERETRTDPLTQAGNRRAFSEALRVEIGRARRYASPLGLGVVDLDHFKRTNDTFGHAGGDEVLRAFAERARRVLREGDALFRIGGEEFALLLPCTDLGGSVAAAERLLAALREAPVPFCGSYIAIAASVGVTSLEEEDRGAEDLFARADAALYVAKSSGRDRVVASPSSPRIAPDAPAPYPSSRPVPS